MNFNSFQKFCVLLQKSPVGRGKSASAKENNIFRKEIAKIERGASGTCFYYVTSNQTDYTHSTMCVFFKNKLLNSIISNGMLKLESQKLR